MIAWTGVRRLLRRAVFAAGVGDAGDRPFAVGFDEIEEVGAAVVDLAVDEEVEGRPDYSQIVVDLDERIVDALFDLSLAGFADAIGEVFNGHFGGFAVTHEDENRGRQRGGLDGRCVAVGHAVEHGVDGGENRIFLRGGGRERDCEGAKAERGCDCGSEAEGHG